MDDVHYPVISRIRCPNHQKSHLPDNKHQPGGSSRFWPAAAAAKPSASPLKAYRQDFDAIAALFSERHPRPGAPTAGDHRHRSHAFGVRRVRPHPRGRAGFGRCWCAWNVLCAFLFTAELIPANPMPMVGRPKQPKSLPGSLPASRSPPCWPRRRRSRSEADRGLAEAGTRLRRHRAAGRSGGRRPGARQHRRHPPHRRRRRRPVPAAKATKTAGSPSTRPPRHPRALPRQPKN